MTNHALFCKPFSEVKQPVILTVLRPPRLASLRPSRPLLDLHEDAEKNLVTATFELPGIKKEDVDLTVDDNMLTVSTEAKISSGQQESGYIVRERRFGKLSRSLRLPQGITHEDIKAYMADGVLTIAFPKRARGREQKKVLIYDEQEVEEDFSHLVKKPLEEHSRLYEEMDTRAVSQLIEKLFEFGRAFGYPPPVRTE